MIHNYRHHERYFNLVKKNKSSAIKSIDGEEEEVESNDTYDSSSVMIPETKACLTKSMKKIHQQHENESHKLCVWEILIYTCSWYYSILHRKPIHYSIK